MKNLFLFTIGLTWINKGELFPSREYKILHES